ncbi:MAG: leucine-rich repeat domain-containing protein, partial [Gammaproteobacteria bacterium]
ADIAMGTDLNWLPPLGPQGEFDLVEMDISRTGSYIDLYPVAQYPHLKDLKAAGNQIQFPGPLNQLQQLEAIDLSNNSLNDIYSIQMLQKLRKLDLGGNVQLQAPDVQMLIQNNPGLTHLGVADISMGTDLNWLPPLGPQGEFDLVELDISRTGSYIDLYPVTQYANLTTLKAGGIQLQYTGPLDQLQGLEVLDLSSNGLTDLYGLQTLHKLRQLNLNGNSNLPAADVQSVIFNNPGLTHLEVADIAMGNDLFWLPPTGSRGEYNLIVLDISRTGQIVDLSPITQYETLRTLKAAGLQLEYADPISQMQNLEWLDLRDNALKHVDSLQLIGTLKLLDLRGNTLIPCDELDFLEANLVGVEFYRPASCVYLNPPMITLFSPVEAAQYYTTDQIQLSASANDVEDGDISNAVVWTSDIDGMLGSGQQLLVTLTANQHLVTATITDSHGNTQTQSVNVTVWPNTPPELSLLNPQNGLTFNAGTAVLLRGEAIDSEEGNISPLIQWTSSIDGALGTGGDIQSLLSVGQHTITARITDSAGATIEKTALISVNALPELLLQAPVSGTVFQQGDAVTLIANATDAEDGDLSVQIVWTSDLDGPLGNGAQIISNLSVGTHLISASVTDSAGTSVTQSVTVLINGAPQISLQSPADGGVYMLQEAIELSATAIDPESGDISTNIEWSSDIDGLLGTGASLLKTLSLGSHTLTATITDNAGGVATVSTQVIVQQIDLNVTVSGNGKRKIADLAWTGSRTSVDIYMDNSLVDLAPASGSLQLAFKESALFKVCETGTNYCSSEVLAQ